MDINFPECFLSNTSVSLTITDLIQSYLIKLETSAPTLIRVDFAIYKEIPFIANAKIIARGIIKISDCFFSINNFFIAGSNNQAIEDVLAATKMENKSEINRYLTNLFVYEDQSLFKISISML